MAVLIGGFTFADAVSDSSAPDLFLNGVWDIATTVVGGNRYLYAASSNEFGIQILQVADDGQMTPVGSIAHVISGTPQLAQVREISVVTVGDTQYLVTSTEAGQTQTLRIDQSPGASEGMLSFVDVEGGTAPNVGNTHVTAVADDKTYVVTVQSGFLTSYRLFANGTLELRDNVLDSEGGLPLTFAREIETFTRDGQTYILTASGTFFGQGDVAEGMGLWRLNNNGTLTFLETETRPTTPEGGANNLGFQAMEAVEIGGRQFVFAVNRNATGITTYEMTAPGDLTFVSELDLLGNQGLNNNLQINSFTAEGQTFLLVSDVNQGLGVFGVDADSTVNANLLQGATVPGAIEGAFGAEAVTIGDRIFALSASFFGSGVNSIDLGGGSDDFEGTADDDVLLGLLGDDTIFAAQGDDEVFGGGGNDMLFGGADVSDPAADNDDSLFGGAGDDTLSGEEGADLLDGGDGHDEMQGDDGDDSLTGGAGDDTLYGDGGEGTSGTGENTLEGGAGADALFGTGAFDHASYAGSAEGVVVNLQRGGARFGDAAGDSFSGIDGLIGSAHDDTLTGNTGQNVVDGGEGNDDLFGGKGGDQLSGGDGDDAIVGGSGNDTLRAGRGDDTLTGGTGIDSFVFRGSDAGANVIEDAAMGRSGDRFDLSRLSGFDDFDDVLAAARDTDDGVALRIDGRGYTILFVGLASDDLREGNFIL